MTELGSRIQSQVASEIDKGQREFFLRQQLKAIQDELGEGDEQQAELNELRALIEEKQLPEPASRSRTASSPGSSACRRPPPSTASSARISTGSSHCRGGRRPRTTSTSSTPAGSSTRTTDLTG